MKAMRCRHLLALLTAGAPARLCLQGEEAGQLGQSAWERALRASPPYDNGLRDSLPACAALVAALSHHQWQLDGFVEEDLLEAQVEEVSSFLSWRWTFLVFMTWHYDMGYFCLAGRVCGGGPAGGAGGGGEVPFYL